MVRNIGELWLNLTKKITEDVAAHIKQTQPLRRACQERSLEIHNRIALKGNKKNKKESGTNYMACDNALSTDTFF